MPVKVLLKEMRIKRGLSQNELARRVEMSLNAIQHIEYKAKAIQLDTLGKLCEALNCQPGDLLTWVPDGDKDQESRIEQGKTSELAQGKSYVDKSSPSTTKHIRSLLTVVTDDIPESA